jgi:hypothetical protein
MLSNTSSKDAPWHIIPADRKWFTRVAVSDIVVSKLESMNLAYPTLDPAQKESLQRARKILETEK